MGFGQVPAEREAGLTTPQDIGDNDPVMNLDAWDFDLPAERIATHPAARRDASRLLGLPRTPGPLTHHRFADLPSLLQPDDLLVVNDTKVMAARLEGRRASGGRLEVLVLEPGPPTVCMIRNARRLQPGEVFELADQRATLLKRLPDGLFEVQVDDPLALMEAHGSLPIPPYLNRDAEPADDERYQTVYAGPLGSAAAPTAGLHFTPELFAALDARGIQTAKVTLHVGIGTFRPLRDEDLERGELHPERWTVPLATQQAIERTKERGGRVIAVGTTSTRTLEAATPPGAKLPLAGAGITRIFLHPDNPPRVVDGLITNFHLPRSSLLLLVASLVGRERLLDTYARAIALDYRFYSYGDAMLIL